MRKAIVSFAALCVALSSHGADGFYRYSSYNPEAAENAPNIGEFSKASDKDARLQTWWHWINGNVSKDGIKKDLDAMAEMGYGTAVIFGLEGSIRGPVKFASPEWYEMFAYAAQVAAENGMEIGAHNCDGWNEAGGPWNPVENSMKKLVWTIEYVDGDGSEKVLDLEKPHHILDFYRDIAVIAWPTKYGKELEMQKTLEDILPATPETIFPADHPVKDMFKGHSATLDHARFITENEKLVPYGFTMKFKKPFEAGGVYCYVNPHRMRPADVWLEASDDGKNFEKVLKLDFEKSTAITDFFNPKKAKYWRVVRYPDPNASGWNEPNSPLIFDIFEFELLAKGEPSRQGSFIGRVREKSAQVRSWMETFPEDERPIPAGAIVKSKDVKVFENAVSEDGKFKWKAPKGKWKVMRLGYTSTGKTNGPASDFGSGLEVDKFSKSALDFHFDAYSQKLIEAAGENAGKSFKILSTDSWECENQNWTEGFDKMFEEFNGYGFLEWVPVFAGEAVDGRAATENFLKDFRRTTSHIVNENFYGHLAKRIHDAGLKYETEPSWDSYVMNQISTYKYADVPQDEIWSQSRNINKIRTLTVENPVWPNEPLSNVFPTAPSAAHFYGKKLVSCESLTSWTGNWTDCPADLKETANRILLTGYNTLVFHTYAHQPDDTYPGWQMEPFGTALNRKLTWWPLAKPFFTYLQRAQYMLQKGRPDSRILALYADSIPAGKPVQDFPENVIADLANGEAVRGWLKFEGGKLVSPGRMKYDFLAISPGAFIRLETLRKIKKLVEEGAVVSGYNIKNYGTNVGGKKAHAEWEKLNKELFGGSDEKAVIKIGKGKIYANYSAKEAAAELGIRPEVKFFDKNGKSGDIRWTKRIFENGDQWYWLLNGTAGYAEINAHFNVRGMNPYVWDAEDGSETELAAFADIDGYTALPVTLKPYSDLFIVFKKKSEGFDPIKKYSVDGKERFPNMAAGGAQVDAAENFTMAVTVSPMSDIALGEEGQDGVFDSNQNFAIYPEPMHEKFDAGHSGAGLSVGKNGIAVYEHGSFFKNPVLVAAVEVPENSRIAVVYSGNVPSLYLNGKLLKTGVRSKRVAHPSSLESPGMGASDARVEFSALSESDIKKDLSYRSGKPVMEPKIFAGKDGKIFAEFFGPGEVSAETSGGKTLSAKTDKLAKPTEIKPPFEVEFDEKWGAPKSAVFDKLISWTEHENEGIKNYSGIAVYKKTVNVPAARLKDGGRAYLEFAKIGDVAEIIINGKVAGGLWKPPYILDVTDFLKPGENSLEIKVANTWANRCLYDSTLPKEKRLTWSNTMQALYPEFGGTTHAHIAWTQGPIPSGIMGGMKIIYTQTKELK